MAQAKAAAAAAVCPQCKTAVEKDGLQRHLDWSCPAAPVACGECDAPSTRGGVAKHMAIDCKATDSSCPLAPYGCTAKVKRAPSEALKRAAFDAHMIASRAEHHKMLTKQIDAQKSLRSALQKQVDGYDFDLTCLSKETKQLTVQLESARQTRGQLTTQLSEYSKLIAGFSSFVREKIKANPALSEFDPEVEAKTAAAGAAAAGAADEKKSKTAAAAAAAPAAAAGAGAAAAKKDAKDSGLEAEDKALQDYADAARGADALMIQYKAKPATALALADWLSKLKAATNSMQQFGRASVTDVQHMAVARCYRVSEYKSVAERRVAAEYINTYYAVRGQTQQVGDALRQLLHAQRLDSALVWALCCGSPLPPDTPASDANLLDSIAMEAAKNLMDGKRMTDAFDRVMARGPPQGDDLSVMWMFAATLGRWSVVKELSKQVLELNPKAMELVHENALQNPNVPDMSVLTDMCVVESVADGIKATRPRPDSDVADLLFMAYEVRSMVIKLVTVTHPDPQIVAEVKAEYADYPNGKDLVLTSAAAGGRVIACSGAVANMLSVVFPISLTGPCTPGNITLSGFADQQIAEGVNVHSTEYLSVNKQLGKAGAGDAKAGGAAGAAAGAEGDAESGGVASTWKGEFKMTNTRTGGEAAKLGTLAATFEITFELFGRSTLQLEEPVAIGVPDAAEVKPKKGGVLGGVDLS